EDFRGSRSPGTTAMSWEDVSSHRSPGQDQSGWDSEGGQRDERQGKAAGPAFSNVVARINRMKGLCTFYPSGKRINVQAEELMGRAPISPAHFSTAVVLVLAQLPDPIVRGLGPLPLAIKPCHAEQAAEENCQQPQGQEHDGNQSPAPQEALQLPNLADEVFALRIGHD